MSLPIDSFCMQCTMNRNLELVRPLGSEQQAVEFTRQLMKMFLDAPAYVPSPWFAPQITQLLCSIYQMDADRYREEKQLSNRFVKERLSLIRSRVTEGRDPVFSGLQHAILGNYLDFSALQGRISLEELQAMLEKADSIAVDSDVYKSFCRDLDTAETLLYLTDNAGEIGFDRIFAEAIQARWPKLRITFCVRGGYAQNDATREDARELELPFPLIDNGSDLPGTYPDMISAEARHALISSDVILSKGMGNVETLYGSGYNIYYAFLVKCIRFQNLFQKPLMTPMFLRDPEHR